MWNALSIASLALPESSRAWDWTLADAALDLAMWFAVCAALGATLSWLRTPARRAAEAPGPRPGATLPARRGALARA